MEDFLFKGLPVVEHKGKYIIFSYYNGKIVAIDKEKFNKEEVSEFLFYTENPPSPPLQRGQSSLPPILTTLYSEEI